MSIRDPIHGALLLSHEERLVVETSPVQRLRGVRQLGFAELAFPGGTHSRYAHSLGAMHVAGRMAHTIFAQTSLDAESRAWLAQRVRLAALLHDVGHAPLSHATEYLMPSLASLGLPAWVVDADKTQATHEDYTVLLLLRSVIGETLDTQFGKGTAKQIASLVAGKQAGESAFVRGGVDWFPLMRQLVSSEFDADRMDYLLRDSFYTGVNYGKYDLEWLCQNVLSHTRDGRAYLAIGNRAIFAFEDFLLSRLHMFLAVYYHYVPVGFDHLMWCYAKDARGEYAFPADPEAYVQHDDVHFSWALRQSKNPWARHIAERRGYKLLLETTERDADVPKASLKEALQAAKIDHFDTTSAGVLSKYFQHPDSQAFGLYVVTGALHQATPLTAYTPLFQRYSDSVKVSRVYCTPERFDEARAILERILTRA